MQVLLQLCEAFPHRRVVTALIELRDHATWGGAADRALSRLLKLPSMSRAEWERSWRQLEAGLPDDLGAGWLKRDHRAKGKKA
jgi:hypothetical protein